MGPCDVMSAPVLPRCHAKCASLFLPRSDPLCVMLTVHRCFMPSIAISERLTMAYVMPSVHRCSWSAPDQCKQHPISVRTAVVTASAACACMHMHAQVFQKTCFSCTTQKSEKTTQNPKNQNTKNWCFGDQNTGFQKKPVIVACMHATMCLH